MNPKYLLFPAFLFLAHFSFAQIGIYWLNTPTGIERMDENGENRQTLISWEVSASPQGIAMDLDGQKLYWTDWVAKKIVRSNFDGSNVEDLMIDDLDLPEGIDLDIANQKMYWVDSGTKKIQRANMNGTNVEDLVVYPAVNLDGIAIDSQQEKMYWTLWGEDSAIGKVVRANIDGSDLEVLISIPNGILKGLDLDIENGKMYWTDCSHAKIQRANLDGSEKEDLVYSLGTPNALSLDLNNQKIYWTNLGAKNIQRANLDGTNAEIVADTLVQSPQDLVVNFDFVNAIEKEVANFDIQIFPNPTSDFLTVVGLEKVNDLQVLEMSGKVLQRFFQPSAILEIEVSAWSVGVYFLEITDRKGGKRTKQFQVLR